MNREQFSIIDTFSEYINKFYDTWLYKVGSALSDQAIFAGSNFILNILLARWMQIEQYGAFVVAYSWFLLVMNFYDAMLIEPMMIYGSDKYFGKFREYLGFIFRVHIGLSVVLGIVLLLLGIFAVLFDSYLVAYAIIAAGVATPFILMRWLARQPFYVMSRPHWSTLGGVIYFLCSASIMFLLDRSGNLSPVSALSTMAISSLIAGVFLTFFLLKPIWNIKESALRFSDIIRDHWNYGKWSTSDRLMLWLSNNIYYLVLPLVMGLAETAAYRAITNLILPIYMSITALLSILVPYFVRSYAKGGYKILNSNFLKISGMILLTNVLYASLLILFGEIIFHFLYDGIFDEYLTLPIILIISVGPIFASIAVVTNATLRVIGQVKQTFYMRIIPSSLTVFVGIFLLIQLGILGGFVASTLSSAVFMILLLMQYIWFSQQQNQHPKEIL